MTKSLLLLRHGKAAAAVPGIDDHGRPLVPRGERDAAAIGRLLSRETLHPDLVLCSTATRTRQTLNALDLAGDYTVNYEGGLYLTEADGLMARLRRLGPDHGTVMIIGHNLGLEHLAHRLAGGRSVIGHVPTAGLAWFHIDGDWPALETSSATLVRFVNPKDDAL